MAHQWLTPADVRDVWSVEGVEGRVAALATAQGGVVGRRQVFLVGATHDWIAVRLRGRRWHPLHRGVYAVGHEALTVRGRAIGALLAAPPGALLADRTAAAIWEIGQDDLSLPHLLLPAATKVRPATLVAHRSRHIPRTDRRTRHGLPLTSPERTLLDMAETSAPAETARALREARVSGLVTPAGIERRLGAATGRRGVPILRSLLQSSSTEPTRSQTERRFRELVRGAGLTGPLVNHPVNGYLCDFVWPGRRLIVETDDFNTHGDPRTFASDRARDADLQRAGYRVLRFTRDQILHEPLRVLAAVAALLTNR